MKIEEAIERIKTRFDKWALDNEDMKAVKTLIPELKESEDERIRKFICSIIDNLEPKDFVGVKKMNVLAWLEEQPKEELVYRLNGLMQDYIKEGKDEEEKEHRFKCYQLFWDALEDAEFFEQKEQKPIKVYDNMDDLIADAMIDEISKSDMLDRDKHNRIFWINKHRQQPAMKNDIIDEIRAEIKRRFSEYNHDSNHHIQAAECASILDFLNTLKTDVV